MSDSLLLRGAPLSIVLLLGACSVGTAMPGRDSGGGGFDGGTSGVDSGTTMADAAPRIPDAGRFDPFDPESGCGSAAIPTQRVPGSLLIVFDRSGSMSDAPNGDDVSPGNPSKWDRSRMAVQSVLTSVSDELSMGLMLFPTGEGAECDVALSGGVPQVPIAPLSTSRAQIGSALSGASASGGVTPIFDALRAGYDYLDTLDTPGQRGLVVVTDGAENCDDEDREDVMAQVAMERADSNYLTYAVGLTTSNSDLSTIAYNGGTPRNDTCLPQCTTPLCYTASDCPSGAPCRGAATILGQMIPGFCDCVSNADCPMGQTCETIPFIGWQQCEGPSNCCHYDASESSFEADFEAALDEIAQRFLDSCVFELPRGSDPSMFDPALVNVGVTFEGEDRTVLRRSSDSSTDSWDFTSSDHRSIIIQGPICDRLLSGAATVEIVLGCPTILI